MDLNLSYKKNKFHVERKTKAFVFLMNQLSISMKEAQRLIDRQRVIYRGEVLTKKSMEIIGEIEVVLFEPHTQNLLPIFETREFALYDKPSGLVIHPTNRQTPYSLTHEIKYRYGSDANITHRIDRETSGLVIVSKYKAVEREIKRLFERREVKKTYHAYVRGNVNSCLNIDAPILKNRQFDSIKLKVIIDPMGKPSQTKIKPLSYDSQKDITLIEAEPLTGRQHQIRVHLNHIGHPIVGDPIYGVDTKIADAYLNGRLDLKERIKVTGAYRLMLQAQTVEFFYKNNYKLSSKLIF